MPTLQKHDRALRFKAAALAVACCLCLTGALHADEVGSSTAPITAAPHNRSQVVVAQNSSSAAPTPGASGNDAQQKKMKEQAKEWSGAATPMNPLGYAPSLAPTPKLRPDMDFLPVPDRWRIGFPTWDRYPPSKPGEYPYRLGHWWDPYDQNVLKGDYPIWGQHTFLDLTAVSDTSWSFTRLPRASGVSTEQPNSPNFFGSGDQNSLQQNFIASFDLFHGDAGFKPFDWQVKITPVFNVNFLGTNERGIVNINPADGTTRLNGHIAFQELFVEYKLADLSPYYDFLSVRSGIQPFTSDFRGFIFSDNDPGVLFFGNYESNRDQWNVGYFRPLEKDTNSGLNTLMVGRPQNIIVANFTRQDFLFDGYNFQLDFDYNNDEPSVLFNDNGFLVRPSLIGTVQPHAVNTAYFGCTSEGHIGRIDVTHAFYEAVGRDSLNGIAGHAVNINAQMAALELAYEHDWQRYRFSFFYASGNGNPTGHKATGFDTIQDNPDFAGSQFNYFNRVGIGLTGTQVPLINPLSLVPDLRDKLQGQANFVNPGILLYNLGADFKLTPELVVSPNLNYLQFDKVAVLEYVLHQNNLSREIGFDWSMGFRYRPLLIDNIIVTGSFAMLTPTAGFKDIYQSNVLFSSLLGVTLTY
ncbi:MAG: hypothetical protein JO121_30960 [Deltaproteobacteria bacterium]|nr:hypothetical protein [Deltaproteobacteria bacterium]